VTIGLLGVFLSGLVEMILLLLLCWEVLRLSNLMGLLPIDGSLPWSFGGEILGFWTWDLVFGATIAGYFSTLWRLD
jgi:hypothetical protein